MGSKTPTGEAAHTYTTDLRNIVSLIDWIEKHDTEGELCIEAGSRLVLWNKGDYPVGRLDYDEGQWRFTPYDAGREPQQEGTDG